MKKLMALLVVLIVATACRHTADMAKSSGEKVDGAKLEVPERFVLVEGGTFTMGDTWGDGNHDETPTHEVTVSSFHMSATEATNRQVADVFQWAYDNGRITADSDSAKNANGNSQQLLDLDDSDCQISFSDGAFSVDYGKGNYPCVKISWYGAAAYCNFRSEQEGRTPACDFSDWSCDWTADGYRLPTEAEWEHAARGGQADTDPGGDKDHKYAGSDENTRLDDVAWYSGNFNGRSHDVGTTAAANELGIHDLSGSVWEWCWDRYDSGYYSDSPGTDPRGPEGGSDRVLRGGDWDSNAELCRVAFRIGFPPDFSYNSFGFRPVLPAGQ